MRSARRSTSARTGCRARPAARSSRSRATWPTRRTRQRATWPANPSQASPSRTRPRPATRPRPPPPRRRVRPGRRRPPRTAAKGPRPRRRRPHAAGAPARGARHYDGWPLSLFEVVAELLAPGGMAQLRQRLRLDLPDPLPRHPKLPTNLLQRPRVAIRQPKPQLNNLLLPLTQRVQHGVELFLQQDETGGVHGHDRIRILDEIAEVGIGFLADGGFQADRLLRDLQDLADFLGRVLHLAADLLRGRLPPEILQQLPLDTDQLVDRLHHVHRDPDRPSLVRDRPGDRLPNPPGRVRGELETFGVVELLNRTDETQVDFLHQVAEQHAADDEALVDGDDQPQVGLDQLLLGQLALPFDPLQLAHPDGRQLLGSRYGLVELGGGGLALLDRLGEDDLLLGGQQRDLADLLEVHPHRIVGRRLQRQLLVPGRAGLARELLRIELVHHLDDLDVLVLQVLEDVVHLLGRHVDRRQRLDHFFVGEEAAFLSLRDELAHLVDLGFLGHGHLVKYLSCRPERAGAVTPLYVLRGKGGLSPPDRGSRRARRRASRAMSSSKKRVYSSGRSTGFMRCNVPLSWSMTWVRRNSSSRRKTSSAYARFSSAANASMASPRRNRRSPSFAAASRTASSGFPAPPALVRAANEPLVAGVVNQSSSQSCETSKVQSGCWSANFSASHSTRAWGLRERGGALAIGDASTVTVERWPATIARYSRSSRCSRCTTERACSVRCSESGMLRSTGISSRAARAFPSGLRRSNCASFQSSHQRTRGRASSSSSRNASPPRWPTKSAGSRPGGMVSTCADSDASGAATSSPIPRSAALEPAVSASKARMTRSVKRLRSLKWSARRAVPQVATAWGTPARWQAITSV